MGNESSPGEGDPVLAASLERARELIDDSSRHPSRQERSTRRSLRRLFSDHCAVEVTITLTDEVMRFPSAAPAALALRGAVAKASRRGFGPINVFGLRTLALLSRATPSLAVGIVTRRVRGLTANLILDADAASLEPTIADHRRHGIDVNVNVLGEAVLGDAEASDRLARVIEMARRPSVNYVSVKLSSIVGQLITIDHAGSVERVCERLRVLYREADLAGTFVNLDMEEYRDLRLTLDAFMRVLDEPAFFELRAGIVLQAYLPDSHDALEELISWATRRRARGGAPIKVRLVKGANLAMEQLEAELHGWAAAPYDTKADVDASYCHLIDVVLRPELASIIRVGVASHNLFHVAWALELARDRGVLDQIDVEMLEGMANAEALALVRSGQPVLLYAPVTRRDDFASAVAYLVRRLDENTAPSNYLRSSLTIADDRHVFADQRQRFLDSVARRDVVAGTSRRRTLPRTSAHFSNEPDGDPTNRRYVEDVTGAIAATRSVEDLLIDSVRHPNDPSGDFVEGRDPNDHDRVWYHYRVATRDDVDHAVATARHGASQWAQLDLERRTAVLDQAAHTMAERRAAAIAVMTRDGGKTVAEADPEVSEGVDFARFYARHSRADDDSSPLGVVLVVPPWNFPYAITAGGVLAALAAGNAVIVKPAPETVAVAYELVEQLWAGGVARDALQLLPTRDDEVGRYLVTHGDVDAVILTGSFETAQHFISWRPDLRLLAETSGKNAMVVTASADVDLAVKDLVHSAFSHAGQKCSAASLAIVEASLVEHSNFLSQLSDAVASLRVGPAYDLSSDVGPLIRAPEAALRRALTTLDDGETWLIEPVALDDEGLRWRPGVKLGVRPGSWSHLHEWFGPVLAVMVARDLDEAIEWQNQTPFGLTGGLHSLNVNECERWIDGVEVGNLYVNRGTTGAIVARQPFGGWKSSSVGPTAKAGGANYVDCLRHWRSIEDLETAMKRAEGWWHEHGERSRDDAGLVAETNVTRYRLATKPTVVRVDAFTTTTQINYLLRLVTLAGLRVEFSSASLVRGLFDVTLESVEELVERADSFARVRWLSTEIPPTGALLSRAANVDVRPLAQAGEVELPRWLLEQSVAVTNHRYGNVHAGPKPRCPGLHDGDEGSR